MRNRLCGALVSSLFAVSIACAAPEAICRPHLELNPFRPTPTVSPQRRVWNAELIGYASQCKENPGLFQLQITQWKENAPDLDVLVTEVWQAGQFEVELTMTIDEAIGTAQMLWISRCSCSPRTIASDNK